MGRSRTVSSLLLPNKPWPLALVLLVVACAPTGAKPPIDDISVVRGLTPFFTSGRVTDKEGQADHFEVHRTYSDVCEELKSDTGHAWVESIRAGMHTFVEDSPSGPYRHVQVSVNPGRKDIAGDSPEGRQWSVVMVVRRR